MFQSAAKHEETSASIFYHEWLCSKCVVLSDIVFLRYFL